MDIVVMSHIQCVSSKSPPDLCPPAFFSLYIYSADYSSIEVAFGSLTELNPVFSKPFQLRKL